MTAGPRGIRAGSPQLPASTFSFVVVAKLRLGSPRRRPAVAAALHGWSETAPVSQELLCSGRDGGGAGGDVVRRALALLWNAGSGAAPPPLPPAGETRASPGRAPRAPRRLCSLRGPAARH